MRDIDATADWFVCRQRRLGHIETGVKLHGVICVCIVLGMLAVGLVPFCSPRNAVHWLPSRNGVRLGRHPTILSDGAFGLADAASHTLASLEIWVRPDRVSDSSTILAFSTPNDLRHFRLQQYLSSLIMTRSTPTEQGQTKAGIEAVLHRDKPVFVTITSGARQSAVYVDGVLADTFSGFSLDHALSGQLIIGTSPDGRSDWHGELLGLAFYDRQLASEQVVRHYRTWTRSGRPEVTKTDGIIALYLLNERAGSIIHNATETGVDLKIPERYTLLHRVFLQPFWTDYKPRASYYIDILVNVLGFIPLGVFLYAYWIRVRPIRFPTLTTLSQGFAVSATIEILQFFLPTRNSGMTDLVTNTFGTYLGVKLYAAGAGEILEDKVNKLLQITISKFYPSPETADRQSRQLFDS